ncbi:2-C-methyl-D-erythritol 2,4-cyclodiphosphate synthase [soil metagenome]
MPTRWTPTPTGAGAYGTYDRDMLAPLLVGHGLDSHRLVPGRRLVIGGVSVDAPRGAEAHSDGDVLLHALCDALLSTAGLGDIGQHFPDTDGLWLDFDSVTMIRRVRTMLARAGVTTIVNVACVVILDEPRLSPRRDEITRSVGAVLGLPVDRVGLSFKTTEGMAPDHVQASVTVLLELTAAQP